jgi:hypothetical protein
LAERQVTGSGHPDHGGASGGDAERAEHLGKQVGTIEDFGEVERHRRGIASGGVDLDAHGRRVPRLG